MITEIISGIYIGNIYDLLDENVYKKYEIDIVINMTNNIQFLEINIAKLRYPIYNFNDFYTKYTNLLIFIYKYFIHTNILICSDEQYAILLVSLFLIKYGKIPSYEVKALLKNIDDTLTLDYDLSIFEKNKRT